MRAPVMIVASGTGGHVFPALAVAEELRDRGVDVVWVGSRRGIEARLLPKHDMNPEYLEMAPLRRRDRLGLLLAAPRILLAVARGLQLLLRHRPRAVLAMGGILSSAVGLATRVTRTPLVLHEQNATAGLANRLLASSARLVLTGFARVSLLSGANARHVGNPARRELTRKLPVPGKGDGPLHLLVLGGSQGSSALNEVLPETVRLLDGALPLRIWHQTGEGGRCHYPEDADVRITPFIDGMEEAYAWADLVLARAGALTLAELALAGRGAILVPYPHAADDHQAANARVFADAGAAEVLEQSELTPSCLGAVLRSLGCDRAKLQAMGEAAQAQARPRAAQDVADLLLECAA